MRRRSISVLLLLGLVPAGVSAAGGASTNRIAVLDRSVRPPVLTIAAGTGVTWTNRGRRVHRVKSDTRAWAAFALKPGRSRSVAIARPGRYPYHVDGRVRALVNALASRAEDPPYALSKWSGEMASFGTLSVPGNDCHDKFTTTFELEVGADGKLTGTGDAVADIPATCTIQPSVPPVTAVTIDVRGVVDARAFRLRLFPKSVTGQLEAGFFANWLSAGGLDPPTQVVPIVNARTAAADLTLTDTGPYHAGTVENIITLTCPSCAKR